MRARTILAILLAASLAGNVSFLVTAVFARSGRQTATLDRLSPNAEQVAGFERVRRAFQAERARHHHRMTELRDALADEYQKERPDRERLTSAAVAMAQVQAEMRPKVVDHLLALHALLTPEQRSVLADIMRAGGGPGAGCPGAVLFGAPGGKGSRAR